MTHTTNTLPPLEQALRRAFSLGQTYWQQADSDYTSHHRNADETQRKFEALVRETCAALAQPAQAPAPAEPSVERMADALRSIREHCAAQPSALAKAIVATCDNGLQEAPPQPVFAWHDYRVGENSRLPPEPAQPAPSVEATGDDDPTWVLLMRPGMIPERKGPFREPKHVEQMVRDLYALHPDCTCVVIDMPHTSYPQSGREWVAMYGDRRRKEIPPPGKAESAPSVEAVMRLVLEFADAFRFGTAPAYTPKLNALRSAVEALARGAK